MAHMNTFLRNTFLLSAVVFSGLRCQVQAQSPAGSGAIEFSARITPTAARPEPVRQFTFYVLTRSYADIAREEDSHDVLPTREEFIEKLKISPELKTWLKDHDTMDLTDVDTDKRISPDDIIHVPEFLAAYQRSNSGGVTNGLPKPKYTDAEKEKYPEKYAKHKQDYFTALKKFVQTNPATVSGIELELNGVNPQHPWAKLQSEHKKKVMRRAPEVAQEKYLAGKADTDLEGHAIVTGVPAGKYWISTLNLDANAGDTRLGWDVPIAIQAGQTTRIQLTNLNAVDSSEARATTP
jgi:hypothetical protein